MELLCLTGMLLSLLAMALKSWRDSITFFVLWFLYYSLYQVKQSICRKAVCYGRLSFPSNNSIDCEKMAFNDGSFFSFYFIPPCKLMILKLYQLSYNFVYSYDQFNGGYCDKGYSYLGQQRHTIHVLFSLNNQELISFKFRLDKHLSTFSGKLHSDLQPTFCCHQKSY